MSHYPHTHPAPATSGLGIAALVLGVLAILIGWLPGCGSVPGLLLAGVGLCLGIAGWVVARRGKVGRGMPIAGTLTSAAGLLLAGISTALLVAGIGGAVESAKQQAEAERARRTQLAAEPAEWRGADTFDVDSPSHLAGTGFLVRPTGAGAAYAVTALHPYDGEVPTTFSQLVEDDPVPALSLGETVHTGDDHRVQRLAADVPESAVPLAYAGPLEVAEGDRVAILYPGGVAQGRVTIKPLIVREGQIALDAPMFAVGASGSPVVLLETGTVVGLLLSADDPESATLVGFERLRWRPDGDILGTP